MKNRTTSFPEQHAGTWLELGVLGDNSFKVMRVVRDLLLPCLVAMVALSSKLHWLDNVGFNIKLALFHWLFYLKPRGR